MSTPDIGTRKTRNRNPYTPEEKRQLKELHAKATKTNGNERPGSALRRAGDRFAIRIAAKRKEGFTWRELAEPLGIKTRTLSAYIQRHKVLVESEEELERLEERPDVYKGVSVNDRHRTKTYFPCGRHKITEDNSYPPTRPGGLPRCKACEKEKRMARYWKKERAQRMAEREAKRIAQLSHEVRRGEAAA